MYFFHEKNILEGYNFSTCYMEKGEKKKQKHQNKSIHLLNWKLSESSVFPHTKLYTWSTNASLVRVLNMCPLQEKNSGYLSAYKLPKLVL